MSMPEIHPSSLHYARVVYHVNKKPAYAASAVCARHSLSRGSRASGRVADTITPRIKMTVNVGIVPTRTLSFPVTWHRCY